MQQTQSASTLQYRIMERIGTLQPDQPTNVPRLMFKFSTPLSRLHILAGTYRSQNCDVRFSNVEGQYGFVAEKDGKFYASAVVEKVSS